MHLVVAHATGPDGYGAFNYAISLAGLAALIVTLGWPTAITRFIAQYSEHRQWGLLRGAVRRATQTTLITGCVGGGVLWLLGRLGPVPDGLRESISLGGVLLPFSAFVTLRRRALLGLHQVAASITIEDIALPVLLIASVQIVGIHGGAPAIWAYICAAGVVSLVGGYWLWKSLPPELRSHSPEFETRRWFGIAAPLAVGGISQILLNRIDILMLGSMTNLETVGVYSAASRIALTMTFVMTGINTVAAPMLASAFFGNRPDEFRMILRRTTQWSFIGALPILLLVVAMPRVLLALFGRGFSGGVSLLIILGVGQFLNAATGLVGTALTMTQHERAFAWITLGAAGLNFLGNLIMIPRFGAEGAAISTAVSVAVMNLFLFFSVRTVFSAHGREALA